MISCAPVMRASPRVLLIDDDAEIHGLVQAMLRPLDLQLELASDGNEGLAMATRERPDLILLDNDMPGVTGLEVLARLKADETLVNVPVIMETGNESNKMLLACFAAGAIDYIRKPFMPSELRARIQSVLERQRLMDELTHAACYDKLTGLANRALFTERLTHAIERFQSGQGDGFALMFLDFDRFKFVNDTLGHDVGDLLLKAIATRLRINLRETDRTEQVSGESIVARLGGDEFVVLLAGVTTSEATESVANRLLPALQEPYQLGTHVVRSSASIGSICTSPDYLTADEMLRDADIAMYEAKARGKGCHVIFTTAMREAVRARVDMESDLREAIGTEQIHLQYQQIVSLETGVVCGVEALVRWTHPKCGVIPPSEFVPIAEETGLIVPLSDQLLREACATFMRWQQEAFEVPLQYVSVNVSRVQLSDACLVSRTLEVLSEIGMEPHQLQLEVTESLMMQHRALAMSLLSDFRAHGVRLAMDDFGTGYSSLSCLHEFPLDVLKVDRGFVVNANRGREFAALLQAVVTLADNLNLKVVAEGIEDSEQLLLLQALGCSYGQGYLLARPMSADGIAAVLGRGERGNDTTNSVPDTSDDCTAMVPPCAVTTRSAT